MTWDDKRKLLQAVFDGKDAEGKQLGIYIGKNKSGAWIYTIKGIMGLTFIDFVIYLEPLSPEDYLTNWDYITDDKLDMRGIHTSRPLQNSSIRHTGEGRYPGSY
jgi:hypothetical protein